MTACSELNELLKSEDSEILREAAFKAGDGGCVETVPLLAGLLESRNLGVQEAAEHALRSIGGSETVRSIIPLLRSDDAPVRNLSMDILREVGNQDFAALVEILHDDDPDIRIFTADILGSTSNVLAVEALGESLLKDPEVNVRYQAAVSLGDLGMREAAGFLNKALGDEEWVQFAVIEALLKIRDESSVAALVRALNSASDLVASMIVEALGEMGNVKAASMLLKRMDDSPTALRNKIVQAIVKILGGRSLALLDAGEREKFREYLLVALEDEEKDIQDAAIHGLAYVGGEAASANVLALASRMDVEREPERLENTISALARIGLSDALVSAFGQDDNPQLAIVAVAVLSRLEGERVGQVLMKDFWDRDRDLQREIVQALLNVSGTEASGFFMDVLSRHEDGTVLKAALKFFGENGCDSEAGETLFSMLDHPYNDVKEAALEACIAAGGDEMVSRFEELFSSDEPLHRLMAVYAMGRMGHAGHEEFLRKALDDEIPDIRKVAAESLVELCGMTDESLKLVVERLNDESRDVRLAVVELLGGAGSEESVRFLAQALEDPDDWVVIRAMEALAGRRIRDAVPKLVSLLESGNRLVVLKVIEALGAIGGQAAFRALLEVSSSDEPEIVAAAEEAVARIQSQGEEA